MSWLWRWIFFVIGWVGGIAVSNLEGSYKWLALVVVLFVYFVAETSSREK